MNMTVPNTDARTPGPVPPSLKRFIWDIQSMVELAASEREILVIGRDLMARLVVSDDWLPEVFSTPEPAGGAHYQLYQDGLERFSVVSAVLPAGSGLLIDRPNLWEIVGVLRGSVSRQTQDASGAPNPGELRMLRAGEVDASASRIASVVEISNASTDQVSISVHVYGGDVTKLNARRIAGAGDREQPLGYANGPNAPPYDILTIQTLIID
jgi:3-mercaptopropionate dioxygenase